MKLITKRTIWYKSKSRPGMRHKTIRYKDGKCVCWCDGFVHHQTCWHVKRIATLK